MMPRPAILLLGAAALAAGPEPRIPLNPAEDKGPEIVMLDQVPGCYGPVRFDHKLHVGMSSIKGGCENCHHDLIAKPPLKPSLKPCRECHEPATHAITGDRPGLRGAYHRQCLGCHREWAHENACGFCHTTSSSMRTIPARLRRPPAAPEPHAVAKDTYVYQTGHKAMPVVTFQHADHAGRFGVSCSDCHGGTRCGDCHGGRIERPVVNRQQRCYTCHEETRCITCHNVGENPRFEHSVSTRWFLRPGHATLACRECHGTNRLPREPAADACKPCHAKRYGDLEFDHARTGVALAGDHAYFGCIECHRGGDDRMLASCTKCHLGHVVQGERVVGPLTPAKPAPEAERP